jgi:hypothetical protein
MKNEQLTDTFGGKGAAAAPQNNIHGREIVGGGKGGGRWKNHCDGKI